MLWHECKSADDVKFCMVASLKFPKFEMKKNGWELKLGFRTLDSYYTQVWYKEETCQYAYNVSQNEDWDTVSEPNGGLYKTFSDLLDGVPKILYKKLVDQD